MTEQPPPDVGVVARITNLLGLGGDMAASALAGLSLERLERYTRRQLLLSARYLGLTGLTRLTKAAIAARFHEALRMLGGVLSEPVPDEELPLGEPADRPHKFDLGRPPEARAEPEHIPWGYGQDRVTALVVDPDRLFVYWEATDEAIAHARLRLGAGGADAWPSLRVYDVTGRLFDGTNAHSYFDHQVERSDRQWFFEIGKPGSTALVELGLKSLEGYFVRIARSGRADFPRREPVPADGVEWLTVRAATGDVGAPFTADRGPAGGPPESPGRAELPAVRAWDLRQMSAGPYWLGRDEGWTTILEAELVEGGRTLVWEGPVIESRWEAGPFPFPVDVPARVEERYEGEVTIYRTNGRVHVVSGPWQVVIRGIGGRAEGRVLGVWEVHRRWTTSETVLRQAGMAVESLAGGSEARLAAGASEQRWVAGSELRLGGASELFRIGASELRYGGASERVYAGASERRLAGASEWTYRGASEWSSAAARERGGASERAWPPLDR